MSLVCLTGCRFKDCDCFSPRKEPWNCSNKSRRSFWRRSSSVRRSWRENDCLSPNLQKETSTSSPLLALRTYTCFCLSIYYIKHCRPVDFCKCLGRFCLCKNTVLNWRARVAVVPGQSTCSRWRSELWSYQFVQVWARFCNLSWLSCCTE